MASSGFECYDEERRSLEALLDAFGSFCSLEEIASAYSRSKGDVIAAGNILCKVQDSKPQVSACEQSGKIDTSEQDIQLCEISTKTYTKMSKSKKASASVGTVSSVLGNSYTRPSYPVKETMEKAKPPKIEVQKSLIDARPGSSGFVVPKKETLSNREIEQFLFSMLGDGFKLSMDVIREVLGSCGYDIKKSMEELLDFSTRSLEKGKAIDAAYCESSSQEVGVCVENPNSLHSNSPPAKSNLKDNSDLSQQLLQSLFTVRERLEEEPFKPRFDLGVNRIKVTSRSVVSKPLEDVKIPMPSTELLRYQLEHMEIVPEDDDYKYFRDVTKQNLNLMKEYYGAAVSAFINGEHERANYLLEQGKHYFELAREFEEKSATHIAEPKKKDDEEISLDLRVDDSKDALYLLKMHICKLVNIPNLQYLKVIVGPEGEDAKKVKIRRKVLRLLEKESIQWTEDEANPGTISIQLDQIDHSKLSFAKKFIDIAV